jgi:hypothetical protein
MHHGMAAFPRSERILSARKSRAHFTLTAKCSGSRVFDATNNKPVILLAVGSGAEHLLPSDITDFAHGPGAAVYGVNVCTPKMFPLETGVVEQPRRDRLIAKLRPSSMNIEAPHYRHAPVV